ncbi:transposase, partial [Oceanospirillum sediminis]|uniref:transposase n=1 Tax=Oceanospirillum sediminis TaxID=2760088 RepID=UPI001C71AE46
RNRKRTLCRRRSAIEPIIGHLKQDYRLSRNGLKGSEGDAINLLMAACAWNLKKWMSLFFLFEYKGVIQALVIVQTANGEQKISWLYFLEQ